MKKFAIAFTTCALSLAGLNLYLIKRLLNLFMWNYN